MNPPFLKYEALWLGDYSSALYSGFGSDRVNFLHCNWYGAMVWISATEQGSHRVMPSSAFLWMTEHLPAKVINDLFIWFVLLACAAFALLI